jgi:hypothetical protein
MATETRDVTDLMRHEFHDGPMSIKVQSSNSLPYIEKEIRSSPWDTDHRNTTMWHLDNDQHR